MLSNEVIKIWACNLELEQVNEKGFKKRINSGGSLKNINDGY